jgi:hypothetical protein
MTYRKTLLTAAAALAITLSAPASASDWYLFNAGEVRCERPFPEIRSPLVAENWLRDRGQFVRTYVFRNGNNEITHVFVQSSIGETGFTFFVSKNGCEGYKLMGLSTGFLNDPAELQ